MTKTTAVLALLLLLPAAGARAQDSAACYSIQDADWRAYCLAKAYKEPSACYSIQRSDLRALCRAEAKE